MLMLHVGEQHFHFFRERRDRRKASVSLTAMACCLAFSSKGTDKARYRAAIDNQKPAQQTKQ